MVPEKESLQIEFKSDRSKLSDLEIVEVVVGMANTQGGTLYLGVEDDGRVTGLHKDHKDVIGACAMIANRTIPSVSVRAELIEDNNVLMVEIPKSRVLISASDGKILRRRLKLDGSPENVPLYSFEINTRLSELNLLDFSAQILSGACIDDFDLNERVRLRNIIRLRKGDSSLLELSDEELDKALGFVKEIDGTLYPTVTGMLIIGKEDRIKLLIPTAKASFQVLEGTKVRLNEDYSKPLLALFEQFENYMKAWNPEREMDYGLIRIPIPEFSESAFREGLINAFCHRDYSILRSVRIEISDEGLTISSPGGFIDGVNLGNLLTVEPHGRNPSLADVFKRVGLAEKTGRGIDRIFEGSILYGRPLPDYSESTTSFVKLFIQRANADIPFMRMLYDEENRTGKSLSINSLLILSALRTNRRLSLNKIAEISQLTYNKVKINIEKLVEAGLVDGIGNSKSREYMLSGTFYGKQGKVPYVRQHGIDAIRYEEMIMKLAEQQDGIVTREDVIELLHVSADQAYRILKKLVLNKKLIMEGHGRGVKYYIV